MSNVLINFKNFLYKTNIIDLAVATTIGISINKFTVDIVDTIVTPILQRIFGTTDKIKKEIIINILGVKIDIVKIIQTIIRLFVTLFIIYFIFKYLPEQSNIIK